MFNIMWLHISVIGNLCFFDDDEDIKRAVEDLSHLAKDGSLYVIADEVGPDFE